MTVPELYRPILHLDADKIVRLGISMVPEGRRILDELSVLENLEIGAFTRADRGNIKKDLETQSAGSGLAS